MIGWLEDRFVEESGADIAKHEQLSRLFVSALREGVVPPGGKLPPEQVISRHLGVSLATVRRCFTHLAGLGVISREHGRGTFASSGEHGVSDLWHYRFCAPGKPGFMSNYNRILERRIVTAPDVGPVFGDPDTALVYIERAVNIDVRFICFSQLYLPADKFARILDEPVTELERINLKDVLTREFHAPTLRMDQFLRIAPADEVVCEVMRIEPGAPTIVLRGIGYSFEDRPISFQRIWIPETEYELNLPTTAEAIRHRDAVSSKDRGDAHE